MMGLNFHSYESSQYQNNTTAVPPQEYVEDSFRLFSENGIFSVRNPISWESWEFDSIHFYGDLNRIADTADKYELKCIYDNHQWECSSWIGYGIGMPNSIMSEYCEQQPANREPAYDLKKDFWGNWWNREISNTEGKNGWDAQLEYLKEIVNLLKNRKSTFGFEILNEPEVFSISQYQKVGHYHDYMTKELRTDKPLIFCWALPRGVIDTPPLQALVSPSLKDDTIYDGHAYPPSLSRMLYFKSISFLMRNIPLYMGEFSAGFTYGTDLTQNQVFEYIDRFKSFSTFGWAFWRWSYVHDQNIPAFNLTNVVNNRIQPGTYFNYLINSIKRM